MLPLVIIHSQYPTKTERLTDLFHKCAKDFVKILVTLKTRFAHPSRLPTTMQNTNTYIYIYKYIIQMQIQIQIQNKKTHVNISKPEKCSCSSFLITNYNASPPGSHQWPSRPLTINCIYFVCLFRANHHLIIKELYFKAI